MAMENPSNDLIRNTTQALSQNHHAGNEDQTRDNGDGITQLGEKENAGFVRKPCTCGSHIGCV
jgi:hypothetical protein